MSLGKRLLGQITVEQKNDQIYIYNIPTKVMNGDIRRLWKTERIATHMFAQVGRRTLVLPAFFAPDFYYMIGQLIEYRNRRVNVKALLAIQSQLLEHTWLVSTKEEVRTRRVDLSKSKNFIYEPLDYQRTFLENYDRLTQQYNLRGFLLAAAAGSGKTLMGYMLGDMLGAERIVVFCPKNATERVWEAEANKLFRTPPTYWVYQHGKPYNGERVLIVHYEAIKNVMELARELRQYKTLMILDESHNFNDSGSQRSAHYQEFLNQVEPRDVLWASGTPIKAMGSEAIPLLRAIDPMFTADSENRFKKIFGRDQTKGVDLLKHRIGLVSYKVEKHQLGLDKPLIKKLPVTIPNANDYTLTTIRREMVEYSKERNKYYKERRKTDQKFYQDCLDLHRTTLKTKAAQREFDTYKATVTAIQRSTDLRSMGTEIQATNQYERNHILPSLPATHRAEFKDTKSIIKYVSLKIQGEVLGKVVGRKRIACHVDMVPYIDWSGVCNSTTKKTVVFTSFVQALESSVEFMQSQDMTPLAVYGKTNAALNATVSKFERDEQANPLVATYQSLSTAVPLVMADTMIMVNAPFRAYIQEQAISRIHRLGADTPTVVWECFLDTGNEPNISTRSSDILAWSQKQVEDIMGIKTPFEYVESNHGVSVSSEAHDIEIKVSVDSVLYAAKPSYMQW